jgi:GPH family glycoside/pentoside/hexuronide:cation symporter
MIADVCDMDELQSHERREGMFGSIYWWVVKLGMAAALAIGGVMLNATGFDVALGGDQSEQTLLCMRLFDIIVPMAFSGIAIWLIASYPITEQVAAEVRRELEQRRGALT